MAPPFPSPLPSGVSPKREFAKALGDKEWKSCSPSLPWDIGKGVEEGGGLCVHHKCHMSEKVMENQHLLKWEC